MVEVDVEQEDLSCIATDFFGEKNRSLESQIAHKCKKNQSMKGNYTIHSLQTLPACFRHNEYTPLCQIHIKDTLLHINVQQLAIQKETNLLIEIDRQT